MSNSLFYSLFDILNNVAIKNRETTHKDLSNNILQNTSYNEKYDELLKKTKTQASQIFSQNLYNKNITDSADTATYDRLQSTMTALSSITNKLETLQTANITALETLYTGYQTQIASYVDKLVSMMTKINSQITILSSDTVYSPMVQSLKQIFKSIRTTLVNNTKDIKKMYNTFDASNIPTLISTDVDIIANSNTAPDILARSGYIN
jgi:predicted  nucleic acid-binding Zn-ribbon protein